MFRKSSSEKSLQGIQKGMSMHFYSHLNKNPQLVESSEEKLMKSVWNDPYVQHNYVMPMASRMGVDYARNQFVETLGKVRNDVRCRTSNLNESVDYNDDDMLYVDYDMVYQEAVRFVKKNKRALSRLSEVNAISVIFEEICKNNGISTEELDDAAFETIRDAATDAWDTLGF